MPFKRAERGGLSHNGRVRDVLAFVRDCLLDRPDLTDKLFMEPEKVLSDIHKALND